MRETEIIAGRATTERTGPTGQSNPRFHQTAWSKPNTPQEGPAGRNNKRSIQECPLAI